MVLKTTFGQSQRCSLIRFTLGKENEEKNSLSFGCDYRDQTGFFMQ